MEIGGLIAYLVSLAITAGIYAVFCLGLNIQWGYTGLFNIGIAGFFCVGAYISAMITLPAPTGIYAKYVHQLFGFDLPFIFGLLGAALVCGIVAFLMSFENFNTTLMLTGSDSPLTITMFDRLKEGSTPVLNAVSLLLMIASSVLALISIALQREKKE